MPYLSCFILFLLLHTCVWFSTNMQFMENITSFQSMLVCIALAIPTSLFGYYASKATFQAFESVWAIKLFGFGMGYVVFPALTWVLLKESPFTLKTMLCISLSFAIIGIQLFLPDN